VDNPSRSSESSERRHRERSAVTSFLRRLVSSPTSRKIEKLEMELAEAMSQPYQPPTVRTLLSLPYPEEQEIRVQRLRAENAEQILRSDQFAQTIQMMNESVVQELLTVQAQKLPSEEKQLLQNRLTLKLEVISDFQWQLQAFIDEYENTRAIQDYAQTQSQEERMNEYG